MAWEVEYTDEFGEWFSSGVASSRHRHMRELKAGDERWYESHVPIAGRLYGEHLELLVDEGEG
jgi:hypothetical protein